MNIELSNEQRRAVDGIIDAIHSGADIVLLSGSAGTGKTSTMKALAQRLQGAVLCAPTWRAAEVLAGKTGMEATSFHAVTMIPQLKEPLPQLLHWIEHRGRSQSPPKEVMRRWPGNWWRTAKDEQEVLYRLNISMMDWVGKWVPQAEQEGVLIVDEASMLNVEFLDTAKAVYGQIILVGDPQQLPPVTGIPALSVVEPDWCFELTEIHRQDDGSPLLDTAYNAFQTGFIDAPKRTYTAQDANAGVPILCWTNKTRIARTEQIRALLGHHPRQLVVGEPLVCKATRPKERERGFTNNSAWIITGIEDGLYWLTDEAGNKHLVQVAMEGWNQPEGIKFQFGYALTVHMAQGGEWPVVAVDASDAERYAYNYPLRQVQTWAYTAVTRASRELFLVDAVTAGGDQ